MHFIFSDEAVLLFDFWRVHSPTGMALSVLVVLLLAVLYEGTKVAKAKLLHKTLENLSNTTSQQLILESDQDSTGSRSTPADGHRLRWFLCYFGQSLVHVIQVVLGYFVMLAIMSYNTWIFLGAIVGLVPGSIELKPANGPWSLEAIGATSPPNLDYKGPRPPVVP
ncbi:putative low affinity copper uptake protein 2 [Microtus ochrogaster]|uniref:Copper transport protein n=1 Tax=Microtus ochrogaster TaxID=79684 RepID=A0A8J6G720_MICOH|nr:putative low affinity copper uptake protein 2 [Microtus ochrogaster]